MQHAVKLNEKEGVADAINLYQKERREGFYADIDLTGKTVSIFISYREMFAYITMIRREFYEGV